MSFSFLFPGQGSQYSGMFKDHFEEFPEFNEVIGTGEEFYKEDESYNLKKYDSLGFINSSHVEISFSQLKTDFLDVFSNQNSKKLDIINVIKKYVPDFMHIETGKNLDQKM